MSELSGPLDFDQDILPPEPQLIPAELAGRWVVWSQDGVRIIGHGASPTEARASAGEDGGPLQYVPTLRSACGPNLDPRPKKSGDLPTA